MKNWKVSDYYNMGAGERMVTRVFLEKEIEDTKKEINELKRTKGGK